VLGPTGRNFAAGMSGGTAFILDLTPAKVNPELVDLTPLTEAEQQTLRALVEKHLAETGSAVAERLLGDWPAAVHRFTAVVPRDYKRVMELIKTAEAAGRNVDEAVMGVKGA
jgi:glutamate synthase (NADPH/NADH) large chain